MASTTGHNPVVPGTPRVISPSPTPSDGRHALSPSASYSGPTTRSSTAASKQSTPSTIDEDEDARSDDESRARTRSRSPIVRGSGSDRRRSSGITTIKSSKAEMSSSQKKKPAKIPVAQNGSSTAAKDHLSPSSANGRGVGPGSYWRELSRSPSPLGLIPIHRHWRSLVSRHPPCLHSLTTPPAHDVSPDPPP